MDKKNIFGYVFYSLLELAKDIQGISKLAVEGHE